jgi:hypothetical protein
LRLNSINFVAFSFLFQIFFILISHHLIFRIGNQVPDIKASHQASSGGSQNAVLQYTQLKPEEINKVLEDVNNIKSKQRVVDDSLMTVKK